MSIRHLNPQSLSEPITLMTSALETKAHFRTSRAADSPGRPGLGGCEGLGL